MTDGSDADALVEERLEQLLALPGDDPVAFLGAQFDLGLAWVQFPEGLGGLGLSPRLQPEVDKRVAAAGGPSSFDRNPIGHGMVAPTLVAHGTTEQQSRHLRPLFTGEEVWCQLFSEPDAGSDVANAGARAVRDGDQWHLDGQKVWTSFAHVARWGLLLARTDPTVPKHRGMTCFLLDMQAPGVEVRPLRQMTGDAEFNEVYLSDVVLHDGLRLGEPGSGWNVVLTTLMNERVALGGRNPERESGPIAAALEAWRAHPHRRTPVLRDRLCRLWITAEVTRLTSVRATQQRLRGVPGPEGSIGKLVGSELNKQVQQLCVDIAGPDSLVCEPYGEAARVDDQYADPVKRYLRSRANTIEGGTSEILRNILGERVLGLPGEPRVDRDRPWADVGRAAPTV